MPKKNCVKSLIFLGHYLFYFIIFFPKLVLSEGFSDSINSFGVPGLIDMPIAGSFTDGEIGFTSSKHGPNLRNTLTFQALPRVIGAFRYSGIGDKKMLNIDSGYAFWDRSFDLRIDVLKSNRLLPDVTMGLQDFIGTGKYSGEYLVATKSLNNKLRLTAGLGWGRLASRKDNVVSKTGVRNRSFNGLGGALNYKQLFRGDVATFGGLEFQTSFRPLKLQAEISSDDYSYDSDVSNFSSKNQINMGAEINLHDILNLSAYYVDKKEIGLSIKISGDPKSSLSGNFMEPVPEPFYSIPFSKSDLKRNYIYELTDALKKEKISLIASKEEEDTQIIIIENGHYTTNAMAFGRTLRIMSRYVPLIFKTFKVVISEIGVPIVELSIDRNKVAHIIDAPNAELITKKSTIINDAKRTYKDANKSYNFYPDFYWSVYPYYKLHLFDPDKPFYYDLGPKLKLSYVYKPGLFLSGEIEKSSFSTFDEIRRGPKGSLPKVRTDLKNYLNTLETRIRSLTATSIFKVSNSIYGRITSGYLESMYAGVSAETLYFSSNKNISLGAEINYVKPREFRQLFGFRQIKGMPKVNGHISGYWNTNYYYYNTQLDIGRYLAGDKGATLTVSRDFPNGWAVGGFFSLTDASFAEFGEGSFDKGIFLKIPLNGIVPYETQTTFYEKIRPIQGDGGQKLNVPLRLYNLISNNSENKINNSWSTLWR